MFVTGRNEENAKQIRITAAKSQLQNKSESQLQNKSESQLRTITPSVLCMLQLRLQIYIHVWISTTVNQYSEHYVLLFRRFNMLPARAGDDDCVGNKCSDIEAKLMRRGGRLPERLIIREREWFACKKLTPMNGQLSVWNWRVPNRGKLIGYIEVTDIHTCMNQYIDSTTAAYDH